MADRRIAKRLKNKVMSTCVTPACLYGTETLALTELQQHRLQVCENNWVRRDGSAEKLDTETGEEQTTVGRTERMADDRQPKRAAELREQTDRQT